jgi:hypothetical protein
MRPATRHADCDGSGVVPARAASVARVVTPASSKRHGDAYVMARRRAVGGAREPEVDVVKHLALTIAAGALALASGCAHEYQYAYVPVGPGTNGGAAASYPVPPAAPQGEAWVTSFGYTDLGTGPDGSGAGRLLHARLAVSNGSATPWTVDGRQQVLVAQGMPAQAPVYLNTDAGEGPLYQVAPGRANVFDFYYAVPPPFDQAGSLGGFALDWNVDAAGQPVAEQTAFSRFDGAPPPYGGYPPYVVVGLGFGVGWWYGPGYPYRAHYRPVIRGYYYAPGGVRGGPWRGAPPGAWRGTPPRGGAWRGAPASGGWRGSPVAPRAAPVRVAPARRGGGGWRGGGGRHH